VGRLGSRGNNFVSCKQGPEQADGLGEHIIERTADRDFAPSAGMEKDRETEAKAANGRQAQDGIVLVGSLGRPGLLDEHVLGFAADAQVSEVA
jgi:hypothetical protein